MKIGIGLPSHIAGAPGAIITDWTRRAEVRGFESVTTIDRLIYPSGDSVIALAFAAGVSEQLSLVTNILLAPLYQPAVLAKQLGSIADASGNRLVVGVGVGSRPDDYTAANVDFSSRGKILDHMTGLLRATWDGKPVADDTPSVAAPVHIPLLFGGKSKATLRRVVTTGDGWAGGALRDYPTQSAFLESIRDGWAQEGRSGSATLHASVNFAFGDDSVTADGRRHLRRYYGFYREYADLNTADMITTVDDARGTVRAYADMGFDRLLFHPTVAALDQVDLLADAVL